MKIQPYLWTTQNKDKKYPIKIRITDNRKSSFINVGYCIKKEYWNKKLKEVRSSYKNYEEVSNLINEKLEEVKKQYSLKIDISTYNKSSFLDYFQKHIDNLRTGIHISDLKKHLVVQKHLKSFLKNTYNKETLLFKEIDNPFLRDLQSYFDGQKLVKNTQNGYFKKIKHLFNESIENNVFTPVFNPFTTFSNRTSKPNNNTLTISEFKGIELFNPSYYTDKGIINQSIISSLFHCKNTFTFQFYCYGMRVSDIILLKWDSINNKHINYTMRKTKKVVSIEINNSINEKLRFYLPIKVILIYLKLRENIKDVELLCSLPESIKQNLLLETKMKNPDLYEIVEKKLKTFYNSRIYKEKDIDYQTLLNQYNFVGSQLKYKNQYIFPFVNETDKKRLTDPEDKEKDFTEYKIIQTRTTIYNKDLKQINRYFQDSEGQFIKTKITSHLPRHSYTSILNDIGLDIYTISQSLGHSDIKTTQTYLKTLNKQKVDEQNKTFFDILSKKDENIVKENKNIVVKKVEQLKPI